MRRLLSALPAAITLLNVVAAPAFADEAPIAVTTSSTERRLRIFVVPEYDSMSKAGQSLSSFGFGTGVRYGIADSWGIGIAFRQGFSADSLAASYTAFDLKLTYAITGSLSQKSDSVRLNEATVAASQPYSRGGLRAEAELGQYYFNGSVSVFPMTAMGVSLFYEFPSRTFLSFELGVGVENLTNGALGFTPVRGFAGMLFWL